MQLISRNWLAHMVAITVLSSVCAAAGTVEVENGSSSDLGPPDAQSSSETIAKSKAGRGTGADLTGGGETSSPAPTQCGSDFDGDGAVGFNDFVRLLDRWGECEGCEEDSNGDDQVSFDDLVNFLGAWGPCS